MRPCSATKAASGPNEPTSLSAGRNFRLPLNDIGFARSADGRFLALLSEYDQEIGYDRKWLAKVQQIYKEKQTIATARAKGYVFQGRELVQTADGEQIRLRFGVR